MNYYQIVPLTELIKMPKDNFLELKKDLIEEAKKQFNLNPKSDKSIFLMEKISLMSDIQETLNFNELQEARE